MDREAQFAPKGIEDEDAYRLWLRLKSVRAVGAQLGLSRSVTAAKIKRYREQVVEPREAEDAARLAQAEGTQRAVERNRRVARGDPDYREPGQPAHGPLPKSHRPPVTEELLSGDRGFIQFLNMRDRDLGRISPEEYERRALNGHRRERTRLGSTVPHDPSGRREPDAEPQVELATVGRLQFW